MNTLTCYLCRIQFGVEPAFEAARRADRELFYCPVGHSQAFKGPAPVSTEEVKELQMQLAQARTRESLAWRQRDRWCRLRNKALERAQKCEGKKK